MAAEPFSSDLDALRRRIAEFDAVSFDVFDTLFLRPLCDPEDAFDILGARLGVPDFRARRRTAQTEAFRRMHAAGRREITLAGIYEAFADPPAPPADLAAAEIALELALTLPNHDVADLVREVFSAGKPVVLTSDMYLPREFFEALLARHDLPALPLFVSSERDATKRDHGALFAIVADALGLPPARILHVGDNPVSDIARGREAGFQVFAYDEPRRAKLAACESPGASLASALFRARRHEGPETLFDLGYRYGGPGAVGFLDWVEARAREDRVDLVLLLSRDGYVLDRLAEARPDFRRRAYFKGSRIAFTLAGVDERNFDAALDFLASGSEDLSPFEVLERIGVAPPDDAVLDAVGLGAGVRITEKTYPRLKELLEALRWEILKVCRRNRQGLYRLLLELGVRPGMRVALVDVGWNGTSQEAFHDALAGLIEVDLVGYYFCLADTPACRRRREFLAMRAMLGEEVSADRVERVYDNRLAIELFFSAPHAAVIGYEPGEAVVAIEDHGRVPVPDQGAIVAELVRGAEAFARDHEAICRAAAFRPPPADTAWPLIRFALDPDPESAALLGSLRDFDAWASSRNRPVAFAEQAWTKPKGR